MTESALRGATTIDRGGPDFLPGEYDPNTHAGLYTRAHTHDDANPYADTDCGPGKCAHRDPGTNGDAHTRAHSNPDGDTHPDGDSHADTGTCRAGCAGHWQRLQPHPRRPDSVAFEARQRITLVSAVFIFAYLIRRGR